MTKAARPTPRDAYLAALSSNDELAARRVAEKAGVPDDDPMWLLLLEVERACSVVNECTLAVKAIASDAARRIEQAASRVGAPTFGDADVTHIAAAAGKAIASDAQVANAVASAIREVEADAVRALRTTEMTIRELMRRRSATPLASLIFAFALGLTSCCAAVWGSYHTGVVHGQELGYRAAFNDARLYDRTHQ